MTDYILTTQLTTVSNLVHVKLFQVVSYRIVLSLYHTIRKGLKHVI